VTKFQWIISGLLGLLIINSVLWWGLWLVKWQTPPTVLPTPTALPTATPLPLATDNQLQVQVASLAARMSKLEKKPAGGGTTTTTIVKQGSQQPKEVFVYLGAGSSPNRDWTDITSAVATLDSANYPGIKAVYFEAALGILGGEAHARLVNKSSGGAYLSSEIMNNSSASKWVTSAALSLQNGQATYGVQVRSTSSEVVRLDGARLRIVLE
jgi:hypothetical protein